MRFKLNKYRTRDIKITCDNEDCEADITISYTPGRPARTNDLPENCYPAEGDEVDAPDKCPKCGAAVTEKMIEDAIVDYDEDDYEPDWDLIREAREDARYDRD